MALNHKGDYVPMLTTSIFIMGLVTVLLSCYAWYVFLSFKRHTHGDASMLSHAIGWQLAAEAGLGAGTLVFAWAAWTGRLDYWPVEVQSGIRFLMFSASSSTTIHLVRTLHKLKNGG